MSRSPVFVLCLICCLTFPVTIFAQFEDEDFPPGLHARYSAKGRSVERVDPDIAFVWDAAAPDSRLPRGPFEAEWNGLLLIRNQTQFRFHAYVDGAVTVKIGGKEALTATTNRPAWVSGNAIAMGFGEKPLRVTYHKTGKTARLKLFWSSDAFELEPLPSHLIFRDGGNTKLSLIEAGRIAFGDHRCNRCHRRENDPLSPSAPALLHLADGLSHDWLLKKLVASKGKGTDSHSRMPEFDLTDEEANSIAAFLMKSSKPVALQSPPKPKVPKKGPKPTPESERRAGEILFRSVGCLACHTVGKLGNRGPFSGGDLSRIGSKRTRRWLFTWLDDPEKLNTDHRMPSIRLSETERRQISDYLSKLVASETDSQNTRRPADRALVEKGRKLIRQKRCANCHRIDGIPADFVGIANLSQPVTDWSKSCLSQSADRRSGRPVYPGVDQKAVEAFLNSRRGILSAESQFTQGLHLLESRNCIACHERGSSKGIVKTAGIVARTDKDLQGQSQALIPPALTAVGDKLLDAVLVEAISGDQKTVRLPWLHARMPKFRHTKREKDALAAYLIAHDRIPRNAPVRKIALATTVKRDSQALVTGQQLVGAKGFSCIACHKIGSYEPKNVALGTRGSDLLMLGKRMRAEFYTRWTRSPLRIVPGMEMPSYTRPLPNVLDGRIGTQLAATWAALNDPRFQAPTNPSSVEQFFVVKASEPARVVRDVFTNPEENGGGAIARALAIGMHNGHNVLYDLATFSVRQWTFGDFGRQRTIGKSWYWDMAGVPVVLSFANAPDLAIRRRGKKSGPLLFPQKKRDTVGKLRGYRSEGLGLSMRYEVLFSVDNKEQRLRVTERIIPLAVSEDESSGGWRRVISIDSSAAPKLSQYDVLIARPKTEKTFGSPSITAEESSARWESFPGISDREFVSVSRTTGSNLDRGLDHGDKRGISLLYRCALKPEKLSLKPPTKKAQPKIEKITSVPGFDGIRLPLEPSIMPTAFAWTSKGTLAFTSLKGHVYLADDSDGDGIEDRLTIFEEGLAAPFGIIADGDDLIVAHKPEVLRLRDTDGDGKADERTVIASGWGYNDNYHDWTCGIVRDSKNNLYIGLGSDYAQKTRPLEQAYWRGKVLQITPEGKIVPVGHDFRYPTGLAINSRDEIFISDQQGVQNTFNEINLLIRDQYYGVPSRTEQKHNRPGIPPAVQIPHPWTRSVNGLFFPPAGVGPAGFANHGIGCEYNGRFLIRFSLQNVRGTMQGATYYFSLPNFDKPENNFLGPMCGAVSPKGEIYIGSIHDSGWLGGQNTGEIVRLRFNGNLRNGIREIRATSVGFEIDFLSPIDFPSAAKTENYSISGYTRVWEGSYATPDSGRHLADIKSAKVSADRKHVTLTVGGLREGHVYEVSCGQVTGADGKALFPATGHYTLHRIPKK